MFRSKLPIKGKVEEEEVRVELDIRKTVAENAAYYYEKAKKARKKIPSLIEAIEKTKREIEKAELECESRKTEKRKKKRERDWYEKFHWFFSSDGFLVLGGKDAGTNQALVRRYMEDKDLFFHADIKGGSVVIIKSQGKEIPEQTKKEAAEFAASFSKAFSLGLGGITVYSARPEQVKTAAKAGEFLPKGGFVIVGEREWYKAMPVRVAVSYDSEKHRVVSGPESAIRNNYKKYILVVPGDVEKGQLAKKIKKILEEMFGEEVDINEILQMLPPGKGRIKEVHA